MIIVYAHYKRNGHCAAALETVISHMEKGGIDYQIIDLYTSGFNPVANFDTIDTYDEYAWSSDPQVKGWQQAIRATDDLIIIYPTWWQNVPAILKGFYDRVFTPGVAFKYTPNGIPQGLLLGKRALIITTTGNQSWHARWVKGFRSIKVSTADTLEFCGVKTSYVLVPECRKPKQESLSRVRQAVDKKLSKWLAQPKPKQPERAKPEESQSAADA